MANIENEIGKICFEYCGEDWTLARDEIMKIVASAQSGGVVSRDMVQVGFFEKTDDTDDGFELRHFHEGMNDVPERWIAAYADKKYWSDFLKEKPYQKATLPQPVAPVQGGGVDVEKFNDALAMACEFAQRRPIASQEAKQAFVTDILVNRMTTAIKGAILDSIAFRASRTQKKS